VTTDHTKDTNALCGQNAEFRYVKAGGTNRITGLQRADIKIEILRWYAAYTMEMEELLVYTSFFKVRLIKINFYMQNILSLY
jgi:hypothetical protein